MTRAMTPGQSLRMTLVPQTETVLAEAAPIEPKARRGPRSLRNVALIAVLVAAAGFGVLGGLDPLITIAAAVAAIFAITFAANPETGTVVVMGIVFSNAAVVAVDNYGIPAWGAAVVPLMLLIPFAYRVFTLREPIVLPREIVSVLGFVVAYLLATLFSLNPEDSVTGATNLLLEGLGLYLLVFNVVRNIEVLRRILWVIVALAALLGTLTFYQNVTESFGNDFGGFAQMSEAEFGGEEGQPDEQRRHAGPIGEQNRWAQVLCMVLPFAVMLVVVERKRFRKLMAAASIVGIMLGVAMTFSRGAVVGLAVTLVVAVVLRYIRFRVALVAALVAFAFASVAAPEYIARTTGFLSEPTPGADGGASGQQSDGAAESRTAEGLAAALAFADRPVFGLGPDGFPDYYQTYARELGLRISGARREAHNLYLGLAAEIGFVGLGAFLVMMLAALRHLHRVRRRALAVRPDLAKVLTAFSVSLVVYLATGFFLHFSFIRYLWLFLALAAAAAAIVERVLEEEDELRELGVSEARVS